MPPKIRQLKATSSKAGFRWRSGKGSHTFGRIPAYRRGKKSLSGNDGEDAKPYQIKDVRNALRKLGKNL